MCSAYRNSDSRVAPGLSPVFQSTEVTPTISTSRLVLRSFEEGDLAPFAAMNADPRVMQYFLAPLSRDESDAMVSRILQQFTDQGFGIWAVVEGATREFVGMVGLSIPRFEADFVPCVEVGWRLAQAHWGKGYATEAATASLRFGFEERKLGQIVSFTAATNLRSQKVMQRIGMRRDMTKNFEHPNVPVAHPLRPHVFYRIDRDEWTQSSSRASRRS